MKKIIAFIIFITFASCGNKCDEIPNSFSSYELANEVVLNSKLLHSEAADVSDSSWITSAKYLSCDGLVGFFVLEAGNKTYIHQDMPYEVWENFKNVDSKGSFYSRNIRGNYQLKLNETNKGAN